MNKKQKKALIQIIISAVMVVVLAVLNIQNFYVNFVLYMIAYLIVGYDILRKAIKGILHKQVFDECFLMAVATVGAIALNELQEGVAVMLFYQIGELFQSYAVGKSRKSITELMDIRPDYANLVDEDGNEEKVDPDDVEVGSTIVVKPGEKIPIDGIVIKGSTTLDTAALTGESLPREVKEKDEVISGCINMSGVIYIETTTEFEESTASKILDLVENASSKKSKSEAFIAKFARVYTPAVCYSALALAVIPTVILFLLGHGNTFSTWLYRALTFLVISCPCALVISIPLTFFAGIGAASSNGVLVKGSNYLEALADTTTVVFDKTGTMTKGTFEVTDIKSEVLSKEELLEYTAYIESYSSHPISLSIQKAYGKKINQQYVSDIKEIAGQGVTGKVNDKIIHAGNKKLMDATHLSVPEIDTTGTIIYVAIENKYQGYIVISDVLKPTSIEAISQLKQLGIKELVMLTGDNHKTANEVAKQLSIDTVYSDLLPADKVTKVETLLNCQQPKEKLAFVGDGINDAPVLSRADIGIAMGALGSDAAIEAADIVLMDDDPLSISKAIKIAKKCLRIVYENIYFAIGIKLICLLLGAIGIANMWVAIFADVGVMVLAVLNAIRALNVKGL